SRYTGNQNTPTTSAAITYRLRTRSTKTTTISITTRRGKRTQNVASRRNGTDASKAERTESLAATAGLAELICFAKPHNDGFFLGRASHLRGAENHRSSTFRHTTSTRGVGLALFLCI